MKQLQLALLLCIAHLAFGQNEPSKVDFNFGFETTTPGKALPDNWYNWSAVNDYKISCDSTTKHSGKNSICIEPSPNKADQSFGCIACKIPAIYKGSEITVSVYMKMNNIKDGPIGLLLRIDDNSSILQFDNMQQKNIQGTSDWTKYTVTLPYPEDAATIYIGALSSGTGQL
jgi:Carbohydrate binding domain